VAKAQDRKSKSLGEAIIRAY